MATIGTGIAPQDQEELLRGLLDSLNIDLFIIDAEDCSIEILQGARTPTVVEGTTCHELLHGKPDPCLGEGCPCPIRELRKTREPLVVEHRHRDADGSERVVEIHAFPILDEEGELSRVVEYCVDVTARSRTVEMLLQAERTRAVAELAQGVAHNFNNLLQIVMGMAELTSRYLDRGNRSEASRRLSQILESCRLGADTVARLQRFAGTTAGEQATVIDLSEVAHQVAELSRPRWKTSSERRGIEISFDLELEPGCLIRDRESGIFEVLVNLVNNAVDAMPRGGRITVRTALVGDDVVVAVRDTGEGIEPAHLPRVFEPFYSTKGATGTGMGLSVSAAIVARTGGSLTVDSTLGEGTTFTIRLPHAESADRSSSVPLAGTPRQVRRTVLLVDDVKAVVDSLGALLGEHHDVLLADSGAAAVETYEANAVDVVVCDLGMTGMTGWEVAVALKELALSRDRRKSPFILLTGWGSGESDVELMARCGVDRVVGKPIDLPLLLAAIEKVSTSG